VSRPRPIKANIGKESVGMSAGVTPPIGVKVRVAVGPATVAVGVGVGVAVGPVTVAVGVGVGVAVGPPTTDVAVGVGVGVGVAGRPQAATIRL